MFSRVRHVSQFEKVEPPTWYRRGIRGASEPCSATPANFETVLVISY